MVETFHGKWRSLLLLSMAELLAMSVWFSASAVVPLLSAAWKLDDSGRAWLTMSVQIGFVTGALISALLNAADRIPARGLFAGSALLASLCTALIPALAHGLAPALALRFLSGMFLAGVYPVGMKIVATWTREDRGLGIGLLVGAIVLGSAVPHLLHGLDAPADWRSVLYGSAALAAAGGILGAAMVREGPLRTAAPRFHWRYAVEVARDRELVLANLGYLGHMWELYAMWSWVPVFLLASYAAAGRPASSAALASFAVVGAGALGSLASGRLADRWGRTTVTIVSMAMSGACALAVGLLFRGHPVLLLAVCLVWGFSVVADSAQFSACVSELCRPEYMGTALTLQTSLGFLLTLLTIRSVPFLERLVGWRWAFAFLALGPAVGVWAMAALRRSPAALKIAGGRR